MNQPVADHADLPQAVPRPAHLALLEAATDRLVSAVGDLDDGAAAGPSALPGWSRAHVVTHLARNADSFTWLLDGARVGEEREQYPGGVTTRSAAIDAGSARSAGELVDDTRGGVDRLRAAVARMDDEAWSRPVRTARGSLPAGRLVWSRLREVEVHHVDLAVGYLPTMWSREFAVTELDERLVGLGDRLAPGTALRLVALDSGLSWDFGLGPASLTVAGPVAWLVAWLFGRETPTGVLDAPAGLPPLRPW